MLLLITRINLQISDQPNGCDSKVDVENKKTCSIVGCEEYKNVGQELFFK